MPQDQKQAPIADAIRAYREQGIVPFTVPGHKVGRGVNKTIEERLGCEPFLDDIVEMEGFDDRKSRNQIKQKAQDLAAELYRADKAFFSTSGSTLCAHVAILLATGPDEEILVSRNCHKAVIAGMILSGARPIFLRPHLNEEWNIANAPTEKTVRQALKEHPQAKAVLVTSPSYYGLSGNLQRLAAACHENDRTFIVDEAWGSHFAFHEEWPQTAMDAGADLSYASLHKTDTALSQASLFLTKGQRVDTTRIENLFNLLKSTSESGLLLASIDASRARLAQEGAEVSQRLLDLSRKARRELSKIKGLKLLESEALDGDSAHAQDVSRIFIDVSGLGVSGYHAADWMRQQCGITFELADDRHLLANMTFGDTPDMAACLVSSFKKLAGWASQAQPNELINLPPLNELWTKMAMTPREAFFAQSEMISIDEAVGRISSEMVTVYPPGIPTVVPGEAFTPKIVEYLRKSVMADALITDVSDPELKQVRVVKNNPKGGTSRG